MLTVFDVLKIIRINHDQLDTHQVVMTQRDGKPNSVLTDLLTDVVTKTRMFVDLEQIHSSSELITTLREVTPLPEEVLTEYEKILGQPVVTINFATRKGLVELVYDEYAY
ncbi:hypothetical protein [Loigolactobacillus iwatensis]|uniref:hypothetical protein n=1 Tax=Loigolactobacillus iwatensis TaxID=1267156 RepID=UPI000F7E12A1|nr:hypothetical protein [Loigolactobacillus iwatensis]